MAKVGFNQEWKAVFDKYDEDGDGMIPLQELKAKCDLATSDIPEQIREQIIEMYDENKDGNIDYKEFVHMVRTQTRNSAFTRLLRNAATVVIPKTQLKYYEYYSCMPPPIFMILISIVEVSFFIYYAVTLGNVGANTPVPIKSDLIYNPHRRYEAWRYLSYMFTHAGLIHIIFNIIVQLFLGVPLEMVHKGIRIGAIYVMGVIAGSLGTSVVDPGVYVCGASAGAYALLAAHLSNVVLNFSEMKYGCLYLLVITVLSVSDVGIALWSRYVSVEGPKVGYVAHFAGFVAGFLFGIAVMKNLDDEKKWEKICWWIALIFFILLLTFCIFWNIFYTGFLNQIDSIYLLLKYVLNAKILVHFKIVFL